MTALNTPSQLTHDTCPAVLADWRAQIAALPANAASDLSLDLSALTQFDSSALAALLALKREWNGAGQTLQFNALPAKLSQLAQLYGVQDLLATKPGV
jgi:phospholipid transport system transporter-binding protein